MPVADWLLRGVARIVLGQRTATLIGRRRRRGIDHRLDPQVAAVLELQRMLRLPALDSMEPERARRFAEQGFSPLDVAPRRMAEVIDTAVAGAAGPIPVRIFVPPNATSHWIVYFHGGGGVIGSIQSSEPVTRWLAARTRCTVASVEYRLGPEHRHPAAIDDALAAWQALVPRVAGRAAVAGDSFGGFLAIHVDRDAVRKPDLQVLIYPLLDLTLTSPSIERYADGYLLTAAVLRWFRSNYMRPDDDRRAASPHYWTDPRGAAPAIVATAGYDPLVDEGDRYAATLDRAGVTIRHRRYPTLVHGFLSLAGVVDVARVATDELCDDIREFLVDR